MIPAMVVLTESEAAVIDPEGVGCGLEFEEGGLEPTELHPCKSDEAASATAPRRIFLRDRRNESATSSSLGILFTHLIFNSYHN
jgi:hypothetical protein